MADPTPPGNRRRTILGRPDRDFRLAAFAEKWSNYVQLHGSFETLDAAKGGASYTDPIVTVTLRSDGSVESIVIVRSSEVPAIDAAARQVILSLAPFAGFGAELSMDYDSIEITRLWRFGSGLRLTKSGR